MSGWMDVKPLLKYPKQVYFDDVSVGDKLPSLTKPNFTSSRGAMYAAVYGDFCAQHFDDHAAQVQGQMPWAFAYGNQTMDFMANLLTDWVGGDGMLKKFSMKNNAAQWVGDGWMDTAGDQLTIMGEVTNKFVQGDENCVECKVWAQRQDGAVVAVGTATVSLPSKK